MNSLYSYSRQTCSFQARANRDILGGTKVLPPLPVMAQESPTQMRAESLPTPRPQFRMHLRLSPPRLLRRLWGAPRMQPLAAAAAPGRRRVIRRLTPPPRHSP